MVRQVTGTIAALALLAIGTGLSVWWASRATRPTCETPQAAPLVEHSGPEGSASQPAGADAARQNATAGAASPTIVVTGRCIAHESGAPLAGCKVVLAYDAKREQRSKSDGRFRFEVELPTRGIGGVRVEAPDRAPVYLSRPTWASADLGDIRLPLATRLTARVVTDRGEPVAGVQVQIGELIDRPPDSGWGQHDGVRVTDADGSVPLRIPRCAGRWRVDVMSPFHDFFGPHVIDIAVGVRVQHVDLVVREADAKETLSGRLLGEDGAPIADLELQAHGEQGFGYRTTRTRGDGRFRFPRLFANRGRLLIRLSREEDRYELRDPGSFAIGTTDIALVARRLPLLELEVQVVDGTTGEPVERFAARAFSDPWTTYKPDRSQQWRRQPPAFHAGGRARLELRKGKHRLSVWPADERLQPRTFVPFVVGDGPPVPLRIALFPAAELRVRLRNASGEPVAGSRIELLHLLGPDAAGFGIADDPISMQWLLDGASDTTMMVILDAAETDASGEVLLHGPPQQEMLAVAARGPGHVPLLEKSLALAPGGTRIELTVVGEARIRGRIEPLAFREAWGPSERERLAARGEADPAASLRDRYPSVVVKPAVEADRDTPWACAQDWPIAADGSFEVRGVPGGSWQVQVQFLVASSWRRVLKATVEGLRPGEVRDLVLDVADLLPAEIEGTAYQDGVPLANRLLIFSQAADRDSGGSGQTDAQGRFRATVLAGRCLPMTQLESPDDGGGRTAYASSTIELAPGQRLSRRIDLYQSRLDLRVLEASGDQPVAGLSVRYHLPQMPFLDETMNRIYPRPTDAEGRLRLVSVPPGMVEVRVSVPGDATRHAVLGRVLVPAGSGAVAADLRLPATFGR